MNEKKPNAWDLGFQAAAYFGLAVGLLWIVSFALSMAGLHYPLLSPLSLAVGILSIYRCGILVRAFRMVTPGVGVGMAFRLCWLTFLLAALLTTMAQYIYFRWIDGGFLSSVYVKVLESTPDIKNNLFGGNAEAIRQVMELMESLTPVQWTMYMMLYNVLLATLLAPVAWIFTRLKKA